MPPSQAKVNVALLALEWIETTHGNDFGHDHHCPVNWPWQEVWSHTVSDDDLERCTCGWSRFRRAFDGWTEGPNGAERVGRGADEDRTAERWGHGQP